MKFAMYTCVAERTNFFESFVLTRLLDGALGIARSLPLDAAFGTPAFDDDAFGTRLL